MGAGNPSALCRWKCRCATGEPPASEGMAKALLVAGATRGVVLKRRIGTLSLSERFFRGACIHKHAEHSVIPFVTSAFVDHVRFIGVLAQFLHESEGLDPGRRVLGGDRD